MSRSYKNNYYVGYTSSQSEKWDKKTWHRRYRHALRQEVLEYTRRPFEDYVPIHFRSKSDVWNMGKDGKQLITYDSIMYVGTWSLYLLNTYGRPLKRKDPLREFFNYIGK